MSRRIVSSYIFLILLFIIVTSLFSGCGTISKSDIKAVEVIFSGTTIPAANISDKNETGKIINAINKARITEGRPKTELMSGLLKIYFNKNEDQEFLIWLDPVDIKGVVYNESEDKKLYVLKEEDVEALLKMDIFKTVYLNENLPNIRISSPAGKPETTVYIREWNFNLFDGTTTGVSNVYWKKEEAMSPPVVLDSNEDFFVSFDRKPLSAEYKVMKNQEEVYSASISGKPLKLPYEDGTYDVFITAEYVDDKDSSGIVEYKFNVKIDNPIRTEIANQTILPGESVVLAFSNVNPGENISIETNLKDEKIELFELGNMKIAFVEADWYTKAGKYAINASINTGEGEKKIFFSNTVEVLSRKFPTQYLWVSSQLAEKRSEDSLNNDGVYVSEAKAYTERSPLWEGNFIQPVEGKFGTGYGDTRFLNGKESYKHSGIDISATTGTPIMASNTGRVALAMELIVTGNTVIIDHGCNLYSSYCHLDSLSVKVGDTVKKGEVIGTVGSTGFSTGPHLHWSMTLNGKYVDPMFFVNNDLLEELIK